MYKTKTSKNSKMKKVRRREVKLRKKAAARLNSEPMAATRRTMEYSVRSEVNSW